MMNALNVLVKLTAIATFSLLIDGPISLCFAGAMRPVFTKSVYRTAIEEHFPFKSDWVPQLVNVTPPIMATENESVKDSVIYYTILSGNEENYFTMQPHSAALHLVRQLDRESIINHHFTLVIQASSTSSMSSVPPSELSLAQLIVDIVDINDNAPSFDVTRRSISIVENLPRDFNVLKLTATDADQVGNNEFDYTLEDPSGAFKINRSSGWLSVKDPKPLDRENQTQLSVWVTAVERTTSLMSKMPGAKLTNRVKIDIQLLDSNDNSPVFRPTSHYLFNVSRHVPSGTIIGQVIALDADAAENGKVSYSMQNDVTSSPTEKLPLVSEVEAEKPFSVHPESGHVIVVDTPLKLDTYTVIVEATDQAINPTERRVSLAVVQITVIDKRKVPKFVATPYQFRIGHLAVIGTPVGRLQVSGFDQQHVRYAIKRDPNRQPSFSVDETRGIIRVAKDLTQQLSPIVAFNVTAFDGHSRASTNVSITITYQSSISDQKNRKIEQRQQYVIYEFNVTENTPPSFVGRIPRNMDIQFALFDSSRLPKTLNFTANGEIYTRQPLDRETDEKYLFVVIAHVRGVPGRILSTIGIVINILDVNDNAPVFDRPHYSGHVRLTNVTTKAVVKFAHPIRTSDADAYPNNVTRYSLSGNDSTDFVIDPITAVIQLAPKWQFIHNRSANYNMSVHAFNTVDPSLYSTVNVIIFVDCIRRPPRIIQFVPVKGVTALVRVHDDNQDAIRVCDDGSCSKPIHLQTKVEPLLPSMRSLAIFNQFFNHFLTALTSQFEINPQLTEKQLSNRVLTSILLNSTVLIQITDNIPTNSSVGAFSVIGTNPIRFNITTNHFHLDSSGLLFVKDQLVSGVPYSFTVQVADAGGLTSETNVTVQVMQLKCQYPVFDRALYEIDVMEGEYSQMPLALIAARNGDCGKGSRIVYSIVENRSDPTTPIEIDVDSGMLIITGTIDREEIDFYHFTVEANITATLRSTVDVNIYVQDANDNAPQFATNTTQDLQSYTISIQPNGRGEYGERLIGRISATDADSDANGNVSYHLSNSQDLFRIDPLLGDISTIADANYMDREYNLRVVAKDDGAPSLSAVAVVNVRITDPPCVQPDPNQHQWNILLPEDIDVPGVLLNLTHLDSKLTLLPNQVSVSEFDLEEGVIWLKKPLDREQTSGFILTLKEERRPRSCSPQLRELTINVTVVDVNDNAPVFPAEQNPVSVPVPSNFAVGSTVYTIIAMDADEGLNGEIAYSLFFSGNESSTENSLFGIDSVTGRIFSTSPLEHESGRLLDYVVLATDLKGSANGKSSPFHLSIHVLNRSHQISLVLGNSTQALATHSENISRLIGAVTGLNVWVRRMEPHLDGDFIDDSLTDVYLYACKQSGHRFISSQVFGRMLQSIEDELQTKLGDYNLQEIRMFSMKSQHENEPAFQVIPMQLIEIAMLAIAVIILVAGMAAVTCALTYQSKRCGNCLSNPPAALVSKSEDSRTSSSSDSRSSVFPIMDVDSTKGIMFPQLATTAVSKNGDSVYYSSSHVRPLSATFKSTCEFCRPNRKRGGQCARCRKTLDKEGHLSDSLRSLKRRHRKMSQRKVTLQPPRKRSLSRALSATSSSINGFQLKPRLSELSLCSHVSYHDSLERRPKNIEEN